MSSYSQRSSDDVDKDSYPYLWTGPKKFDSPFVGRVFV